MDKISALSIEKKSVVNIEDGHIIGYQSKCLIDQDSHQLAGIRIQGKPNLYISEDMLQSFDADVVITKGYTEVPIENGVSPIGAMLLTNDGVLIGRVLDVSFSTQRELVEMLISNGKTENKRPDAFVILSSKISRIGKDAIFCDALEDADFFEPDDTLYSLSFSKLSGEKTKKADEQRFEERFEQMTNRVSKSVNELGHMVSGRLKHIDKEAVSAELGKFTDIVNKEVSQFIDSVTDNFSSIKKDINEIDIKTVLNDLKGYTVTKPVNDKSGQVIIMPGQMINEEKIVSAIRAEKVAELYRVATPMEPEEEQEDVERDKG